MTKNSKSYNTKKDELFKKNADPDDSTKIRKRPRQLRNEHFKAEVQKLNVLAATRELNKLFTTAKLQTTVPN